MRGILIIIAVLSTLPLIVYRAWFGPLAWAWLSYMNPHRLTWAGASAYDMPFAQMVGLTTIGMYLVSKEPKRLPINAVTAVWIAFVCWMSISTLEAQNPFIAEEAWKQMIKIQLMAFVTIMLITSRYRVNALVWVIVISLGFFGVKGGLFTIRGGGTSRVWGPPGTSMADNNEIALALIMMLPLMRYLQLQAQTVRARRLLAVAMGLTAVAIIGSQSRGALLASSAMAIALWWKSRHKATMGIMIVVVAVAIFAFMPEQWLGRMKTIGTYDEDASAMGRINAWKFATNLAIDRPMLGAGYGAFNEEMFRRYAPDPEDLHDAHSIYFEVLGEHGFVGLILFLGLGIASLRLASRVGRLAKRDDQDQWAADLSAMAQVGIIGFLVGGTFLGLAYFDLYYSLIGIVVIAADVLRREHIARAAEARDAPAGALPDSTPAPRLLPDAGLRPGVRSTKA